MNNSTAARTRPIWAMQNLGPVLMIVFGLVIFFGPGTALGSNASVGNAGGPNPCAGGDGGSIGNAAIVDPDDCDPCIDEGGSGAGAVIPCESTTTAAPSTAAPATAAPATAAPTTSAPSTSAPTTGTPTSATPTAAAPPSTSAAPGAAAAVPPGTVPPTSDAPSDAAAPAGESNPDSVPSVAESSPDPSGPVAGGESQPPSQPAPLELAQTGTVTNVWASVAGTVLVLAGGALLSMGRRRSA